MAPDGKKDDSHDVDSPDPTVFGRDPNGDRSSPDASDDNPFVVISRAEDRLHAARGKTRTRSLIIVAAALGLVVGGVLWKGNDAKKGWELVKKGAPWSEVWKAVEGEEQVAEEEAEAEVAAPVVTAAPNPAEGSTECIVKVIGDEVAATCAGFADPNLEIRFADEQPNDGTVKATARGTVQGGRKVDCDIPAFQPQEGIVFQGTVTCE